MSGICACTYQVMGKGRVGVRRGAAARVLEFSVFCILGIVAVSEFAKNVCDRALERRGECSTRARLFAGDFS